MAFAPCASITYIVVFETGFHVAQAGLQLTVYGRLFWGSCLYPPSAKMSEWVSVLVGKG